MSERVVDDLASVNRRWAVRRQQQAALQLADTPQRIEILSEITVRRGDDDRGQGRYQVGGEQKLIMRIVKGEMPRGLARRQQRFQMPGAAAIRCGAKIDMLAVVEAMIDAETRTELPGRVRMAEDRNAITLGDGSNRTDMIGMPVRDDDPGKTGTTAQQTI